MTNTITFNNVWAQLNGPARSTAWKLLSYRPKGFYHTWRFKHGQWDGWNRMLDIDTGLFPTGLIPMVQQELGGHQFELVDARPPPFGKIPISMRSLPLDDHQQDAIAAAVQAERGVIDHATAAGKQRTAIALIAEVQQKTAVFVHRKDLLMQFYEGDDQSPGAKRLLSCEVGIVGAGLWEPRDVTICTFQSVWSRMSKYPAETSAWLKTLGCFIVDEGHHISAETFAAVLRLTESARYRYAFSASPFKSADDDDRKDTETMMQVVGWTGPVLHTVTPQAGIEAGRLVPALVFFLTPTWEEPADIWATRTDPDTGKTKPRYSWQEEYQEGIVENEGRNQAIITLAQHLRQAGPVLILCDRLEHGRLLSDALGVPFAQGETALTERGEAWSGLKEGHLNCVVASRIADEGVDIPGIRFLILAGGGKAKHLVVQRLGRGMRSSEGKDKVYVFDFDDVGHRLSRHARGRAELYEEQPAYTLAETTLEEVLK